MDVRDRCQAIEGRHVGVSGKEPVAGVDDTRTILAELCFHGLVVDRGTIGSERDVRHALTRSYGLRQPLCRRVRQVGVKPISIAVKDPCRARCRARPSRTWSKTSSSVKSIDGQANDRKVTEGSSLVNCSKRGTLGPRRSFQSRSSAERLPRRRSPIDCRFHRRCWNS